MHGALLGYMWVFGISSIDFNPNADYITFPLLAMLLAYTYVMQKNMYAQSIIITALKAVLLVLALFLAVIIYRFFLFNTTMFLLT